MKRHPRHSACDVCAAGIAGAVISLLLMLGWFVVRPATRTIRDQVEELESQVADRTRELSLALVALRHEAAERQQSESNTRRLAAQLAHAERVWTMGHLTAGLAHELNQPLATIANYTEACDVELTSSESNTRTARLRNYLDLTKQAALRAGQIVRRMRNFVRPSASAIAEVEIGSLIHEVVELCRIEAEHTGTQIALQLYDDHATVAVDPIQIQQVLVNLMQNAVQAMREGPVRRRRIEIRTSTSDDLVLVEVIDSGPGIVASDSEEVFEPFYTTKRDGLGIGLSICRAIIEDHGGVIRAESAPSHGANVSFTLPICQNDDASGCLQSQCVCSR